MENLKVGVLFPWADQAWINESSRSDRPGSMVCEVNDASEYVYNSLVLEEAGKTFEMFYEDITDEEQAKLNRINCFVITGDDEHGVELAPVRGSIVFAVKRKEGGTRYRDITQAELKSINSMHLGSTILREKEIRDVHLKAKIEWLREEKKSTPDLQIYKDYQLHQDLLEQFHKILIREAA